jgi:uncharacterized ferritin-like protein (DUF455 family)
MPERVYAYAERVLLCDDIEQKVALSLAADALWQNKAFSLGSHPILPMDVPGRPQRPELVEPRMLKARRLGSSKGRAVLLHAVAHIEFNAINLAWDALYRFRHFPEQYVGDWLSVAVDEARHFALVRTRLQQLDCDYGDFPAHNGLWEMALKTRHCARARMALVPRVLEARGLDVTPAMIEKLRQVGDLESVAVLEVILREEVRHVDIGSRWFAFECARAGLQPGPEFLALLTAYGTFVKLPLNVQARLAAGFDAEELQSLAEYGAQQERARPLASRERR